MMKRLIVAVSLVAASLFVFNLPVFATDILAQAEVKSTTLNVNAATVKELRQLPGVGKVTAERIVAYRDANGAFVSVDGLSKVKGVGKKTLEKIRPLVVVE